MPQRPQVAVIQAEASLSMSSDPWYADHPTALPIHPPLQYVLPLRSHEVHQPNGPRVMVATGSMDAAH